MTLSQVTLLSVSSLREELKSRFRDAPPGLTGLTLRDSDLTKEDISSLKDDLQIRLPSSFVNLILTFDFGDLSLDGVSFGNGNRYDHFLILQNEEQDYPWWGNGQRPAQYLMIAGTDGYVLLLNTEDPAVYAFLRDDYWTSRQRVALDFELFVRGCGTLGVQEKITDARKFANSIATALEADIDSRFWFDRVQGFC